jgi:hypothetical protein
VEVIPSRWDDTPTERARAMLAGLGGVSGVSLESVAEAGRIRCFVRADDATTMARALAQLRAHHPQAQIRTVELRARPDHDPLRRGGAEGLAACALRLTRPAVFPLGAAPTPAAAPRDRDRAPDPLSGVLAAAADAGPGRRVVWQVVLGPAGDGWSRRLALQAAADRRAPMRAGTTNGAELGALVALFVLGGVGLRAYLWYRDGALLPLLVLAAGLTLGLALLALVLGRMHGHEPLAPDLAREKLRGPAFAVHLRVLALGTGDADALRGLAHQVAGAARAFDHPAGNALRPARWRGDPASLRVPWRPAGRAVVLTAAELAGLWHLVSTGGPLVAPARSRRLLPPEGSFARGCRVGIARHQGVRRAVHVPPALLQRNHLIVAKTRRGKSTLLLHLARYVMERLATGQERLSLVVLDPHQDLAEAALGAVPAGLAERVVYLNLADRERPVGINLLDVRLFPERDRTAENIVTMLHRLWPDNWGPRMEGALRAALLSLHEANQVRSSAEQYTLLDVVPLLTSADFREVVLAQVRDLALHAWWVDNYAGLARALQQQIATPVTTKISRCMVNEASRCALGQAASSFDPRTLLAEGGVLIVNSATGSLGEGGAALLGATVLNLLALLVEQQVALPPARRARLIALVDESTTLAAADYPRILSELGKYGASVVLVTQALAKLDAIDRQLRPTVFANIDALTVFQVSAEDARALAPELGPELAPEDLTDLDDYTCYARWWADGRRPAPFSLQVDSPPASDAAQLRAIAARSAARYGRPRAQVAEAIETALRQRQAGRPVRMRGTDAPARDDETTSAAEPLGFLTPVQMTLLTDPPTMAIAPDKQRRRSHARSNAGKRR